MQYFMNISGCGNYTLFIKTIWHIYCHLNGLTICDIQASTIIEYYLMFSAIKSIIWSDGFIEQIIYEKMLVCCISMLLWGVYHRIIQ